jgi:DNA-binding beta-propeller fold protein YncE
VKIILSPARYAFSVLTTAAILAGCGGTSQLAPSTHSFGSTAVQPQISRRSWMAPEAKGQNLLYVTDFGTNDVDVYSYPAAKLLGTLAGFSAPHGDCVDHAGDVFVVNTAAYDILEYAHGGISPIAKLKDSGWYPLNCAVDPKTGNLAVTNGSLGSDAGNVAIYKHAKGTPTDYSAQNIFLYYFCGYDDKGNLYVDGTTNHTNAFEFAELPAGSKTFTAITLDQVFQIPGGVQWDGKHIAVGDRRAPSSQGSTIYEFAIHRKGGKEVGSTPLNGSADVNQFWIQGSTVIGPNSAGNVIFWSYPNGGAPKKTISGLSAPDGATISDKR